MWSFSMKQTGKEKDVCHQNIAIKEHCDAIEAIGET